MYTTCLCFLLACTFTGGTTSLDNLYQSVAGNGDTCVCINKHLKEESNTEYPEIKSVENKPVDINFEAGFKTEQKEEIPLVDKTPGISGTPDVNFNVPQAPMIIPATTASYKEVTPIETPKTAEKDDGEKEKSTTIPTICRDPASLVSPRMVIQRNTPPLSVIQGEEGYDINRMVNYPEESTFINTKPSPRVIRYSDSVTPGMSTYHESSHSNILDHESYPQLPTKIIKSEGMLEASRQVNIPENQIDIQGIPMMGARSVHYSKTGSSIPSMVSASIYSAPRSVSYTKYSSGSISPGEIGVGGGGRVGFNDGGRLKYSRTVSSIGGGTGGQINGGYTSGSIGGYPIGDGTLSDDYRVVTDNADTPKDFGSYRGRYQGYNLPGRGPRSLGYYGGYKY